MAAVAAGTDGTIGPVTLDSAELVAAIELLLETVSSLRGPEARIKLLQNSTNGHLTVTSASRRLFAALSITRPIIQLIITAAQGHLAAFSDGGLFLVSLCASLVVATIKSDMSCRLLASVFEECLTVADEYLTSDLCSCKIKAPLSDLNFMKSYVRSVIITKPVCSFTQMDVERVTQLIIKAFISSMPDTDTVADATVSILTQEELDFNNSELYTGLLLKAPELSKFKSMKLNIRRCSFQDKDQIKLVMVTASLSGDMDNVLDVRYETSPDIDIDVIVLSRLQKFCGKLVTSGVGLLLCQRVVHPYLKLELHKAGVMVVDRLGRQPVNYVLQLTGASPISSVLTAVPEGCFGWLDDVEHRVVHGRSYLHLRNHVTCVSTLLLCSQHEETLAELQDVCSTALHSLQLLASCPIVLAGAGCWQSCVAQYLRHKVQSNSAKLQRDLHCSGSTLSTACGIFVRCLHAASLNNYSGEEYCVNTNNSHIYTRGVMDCDTLANILRWGSERLTGMGSSLLESRDTWFGPQSEYCNCQLFSHSDHDGVVEIKTDENSSPLDGDVFSTRITRDDFLSSIEQRNVVIDNFNVNVNALRTAVLTACSILKIGHIIS